MRTSTNTLFNVAGQGLPFLVALLAIPPVISGLGAERFGLLALGWVILGYFGVLDLGMGRATTKLVAERVAEDDAEGVAAVTWTAAAVQVVLGTAAAALVMVLAPVLAGRVFQVPPELAEEAERSFRLLALGIPFALLSNAFRGVLEGAHRFDLVAAGRVPLQSANYVVPLLGVWAGLGLPGIFAWMVAVRAAGALGFALLGLRVWGRAFAPRRPSPAEARALLGFGGWIALSGAVIPVFLYLDRFLIGSLRTLEEVTFYTAPYDVASRLLFIPAGLAGVLFPLYSGLASRGDRAGIGRSTSAALRWTAILMAPLAALVVVAAPELLSLWLGPEFAARSTTVLRLLAVAAFVNALGFPAVALVEGVGRPDLVAKFHLVELPVYVGVAVVLVTTGGIVGAAAAWLLRMVWSIPLFFALCARAGRLGLGDVVGGATGRALVISVALMLAAGLAATAPPRLAYPATLALMAGFAAATWRVGLETADRRLVRDALGALSGKPRAEEGIPRV